MPWDTVAYKIVGTSIDNHVDWLKVFVAENVAMPFVQFEPRRALRAARSLVANPDDLPQVFTILESLSGDTIPRIARRMRRTEAGRRLLAERPDIVTILADRASLARLPEGSLGQAYLAFVERENISAEGLRAAAKEGTFHGEAVFEEPLEFVRMRMRDTHDLWHAAIGYGGDVLGETALLAFILAQTWNPAIALILCVGMLKTTAGPNGGKPARQTIRDGFRRGLKAAWLPGQDWESMLAMPLAEVRRRLSLEEPPVYDEIRSADLKAMAEAA
jgi:ubiquinone biosynthesis protein COQ4